MLLVGLSAGIAAAAPAEAQYRLTAPSGTVVEFEADRLLRFRDRSDSLMTDLVEDPLVLYYRSFGRDLDESEARDAWPWNAAEVVTDSLAALVMPGNLREAGRAYESYVVLRMHAVRQDPDVPCETLLGREIDALDGFIDGWIVARLLFGGPAYEPLDELVFAREADVLGGLILDRSNRQLGGCLAVARQRREDEIAAYRSWRTENYLPPRGR
ncbi:hypothetical protein [Candidatus Palauibacter sp.]|uniref:hypothetical protein n=1 Tax=Candidatus Palauibacter sp. TaxID=3101350 RepID=UPI003B024859